MIYQNNESGSEKKNEINQKKRWEKPELVVLDVSLNTGSGFDTITDGGSTSKFLSS